MTTDPDPSSALLTAARQFADASRTVAAANAAMTETAIAFKMADATAHNCHNNALEAHLLDRDHGNSQSMGFTAKTVPAPEVDPSAISVEAEWAKLSYGRAEVAAKNAEIAAERAQEELEAAQANLMAVAQALPPADGDYAAPLHQVADLFDTA